jgi:hypothetical protein
MRAEGPDLVHTTPEAPQTAQGWLEPVIAPLPGPNALGMGASGSSPPAMDRSKQAMGRAQVSAAPIRCGTSVSLASQTGRSDEIHSPPEWAGRVVR